MNTAFWNKVSELVVRRADRLHMLAMWQQGASYDELIAYAVRRAYEFERVEIEKVLREYSRKS